MVVDNESYVSKIANFGKSWFNVSTTEKKKLLEAQPVAIKDLPIYNENTKLNEYQFVEKEKLPLEHEFGAMRIIFSDGYQLIADRFGIVDKSLTRAKDAVVAADDYVRTEWTVLPKAMAITVGGMAGFVLGIKRYGIRKFVYAAGGLGTMAAFCYPNETVDFARCTVAHVKKYYADFQKSPEIKK